MGRFLLKNVVLEALKWRYEALYADTLPAMTDALRLLERAPRARL
jgi:hypothetical protein